VSHLGLQSVSDEQGVGGTILRGKANMKKKSVPVPLWTPQINMRSSNNNLLISVHH
jgi:hypothetical protein